MAAACRTAIEAAVAHAVVRLQHAAHQILDIARPCADEFRQGVAVVVTLTQEDAVRSQPRMDEACILDEDAVQADDLRQREIVLAGLQNRAAPSLQSVSRRAFAFDLEARPAICEQHEAGRTGDQMGAGTTDGLPGFGREVELEELLQCRSAANDRTVAGDCPTGCRARGGASRAAAVT